MKCTEIRELLSLYVDNMLDESELREVEEHLFACGDCRKEYNEIKEVLDLLGQTELVPVPKAFHFRLKTALKEEKRKMIDGGILGKPSKKSRWRVITSAAAVFAVGVISFGLYHDILGVLPDQFGANDQTGAAAPEAAYDTYGGKAGEAGGASGSGGNTDEIRAQGAGSAGTDYGQNSDNGIQYNMTDGGLQPYTGDPEPLKAKASASGAGSAAPRESAASPESAEASAPDALPEIMVTEEESAEEDGASGQDTQNFNKIVPFYDSSRSLTSSGVERDASSEEYYNNLLEVKLKDFDYQVLSSEFTETGEWRYRVFIFYGKDGNTYNEEIVIIGKDGKIEAIDPNRLIRFE